MSALHTINGQPVVTLDAKTLAMIAEYGWDGSAMIHDDAIEVVERVLAPWRTALREAVAMIDEERAGTKSGWSHEDSAKLERLRALAK